MLRSSDNKKILKKVIQINELYFFQHMKDLHVSHPHYKLAKYLPKYYQCIDLTDSIDINSNSL